MVFGMCATRVIGFVIGFVKDVVSANQSVEAANEPSSGGSEEEFAGPRFEKIVEEKKEK
jgi:hypothetical protein